VDTHLPLLYVYGVILLRAREPSAVLYGDVVILTNESHIILGHVRIFFFQEKMVDPAGIDIMVVYFFAGHSRKWKKENENRKRY